MSKRSKTYKESKEKIEPKVYPVDEALKLAQETAKTKFDSTIEVHIRLGVDTSKSDQLVRGTVVLPAGTGKEMKVTVFTTTKEKEAKEAGADEVGGEELIDQVKADKNLATDVVVATPEIMPKLAQIARIIGPKGLMPNPKNETVTPEPEKIIPQLKKGKVTFRMDQGGVLHQAIGKASFSEEDLKKNLEAFVDAVKKAKPEKSKGEFIRAAFLTSTMGPSIKVKL